jgi:hypothetical protein
MSSDAWHDTQDACILADLNCDVTELRQHSVENVGIIKFPIAPMSVLFAGDERRKC